MSSRRLEWSPVIGQSEFIGPANGDVIKKRLAAAKELLTGLRTKLGKAKAAGVPVRVPVQMYFNVLWCDAYVTAVEEDKRTDRWTVYFHRYDVQTKEWIDPWFANARTLSFDLSKQEWKSSDKDGFVSGSPAIHIKRLVRMPIRLSV